MEKSDQKYIGEIIFDAGIAVARDKSTMTLKGVQKIILSEGNVLSATIENDQVNVKFKKPLDREKLHSFKDKMAEKGVYFEENKKQRLFHSRSKI